MLTFLVSIRQYIALRDYGRLAVRYQQLASVDGITGLFNRRHFMEAAEAAFAHAQRLGQPFVALMIDVDNFKQINDLHGHIAGDEVLDRTRPGHAGSTYGPRTSWDVTAATSSSSWCRGSPACARSTSRTSSPAG